MRTLLLPLLLVLAACDTTESISLPGEVSAQGVAFRVDRTDVQRGETVELTLRNESGRTVETGVFGCDTVERRDGDAWVRLDADNDRACILPLYSIPSGQTYSGGFSLDVAPGTVRIVHDFNFQGGDRRERIASVPIRVR